MRFNGLWFQLDEVANIKYQSMVVVLLAPYLLHLRELSSEMIRVENFIREQSS